MLSPIIFVSHFILLTCHHLGFLAMTFDLS
jgi:hypothetical protein